jgi:hypothetical protein
MRIVAHDKVREGVSHDDPDVLENVWPYLLEAQVLIGLTLNPK